MPTTSPQVFERNVFPSAMKLLLMVYDNDGQPITPDSITSIVVDFYEWNTDEPIGTFEADKGSAVFNAPSTALQPNAYNVAIDINGASYFSARACAKVVVRFTPTSGDEFIAVFKCNVITVPPKIES